MGITLKTQLYSTKSDMKERLMKWINDDVPWLSKDEKPDLTRRVLVDLDQYWNGKSV